MVFWVIWFAILSGVPIFIFYIESGWPTGIDQGEASLPLLAFTLSGAAVSTILRWAIIPRVTTAESLMRFFVVGVALAEGTALFGIFLIEDEFPETKQVAYVASILGMLSSCRPSRPSKSTFLTNNFEIPSLYFAVMVLLALCAVNSGIHAPNF